MSDDEPVDIVTEVPSSATSAESEVRRSARERRPLDFYSTHVNMASEASNEPASMKEAIESPDKEKWTDAIQKEMDSLYENEVWDLVKLPKDRNAVGSKRVFKQKVGSNGQVERYKARLVAQGFSQKRGLDYDETFSPVVRFESLRTINALAVNNGMKLHQMDVTTAFLNGELEEEVYMKQPEGFIVKGKEDFVCKLKLSIYGLKQSPRCWNSALDNHLKGMGFVHEPLSYISSNALQKLIIRECKHETFACEIAREEINRQTCTNVTQFL